MSSVEDSDEEFESADEDFDEKSDESKGQLKKEITDDIDDPKSDKSLPPLKEKLIISSNMSPSPQTVYNDSDLEKISHKSEDNNETDGENAKQMIQSVDNTNKEVKTIIKGRKIMRKADRISNKTEDLNETNDVKCEEQKIGSFDSLTKEVNAVTENSELTVRKCDTIVDKTEDTNETHLRCEVQENQTAITAKEVKTSIKGRKLMRKADRLTEKTFEEDSEALEQKKSEVLSKLSDLCETENSSNWNNWFSDIKSAAKTATSTTVSHVSQASNKWSFDPKSLLSSAATLTTTVGSGLSSVVDNVASVMDSAIGAPPPEQMAAMVNKPPKEESISEIKNPLETDKTDEKESNKLGFGFGLFDYTLNTLETIGKKTMDVIVDDNKRTDKKT